MWSNFHTHSNYCDGKEDIREYVRKAEQLNMMSLGFSSHAPLPFINRWCMKPGDMDSYLNSISEMQRENSLVEIYKGLEVDYIPNVISPNDFKDQIDYTVGSIHFVEQLPDGTRWEIDGPHNFFLEGFEKIFRSNIQDAITRYFELTREMILKASPTIVGHLDKIKIQNTYSELFNEDDVWYQHEVKKTIDLIGESDCIIEVNTRGIYQKKSNTTYPSPWVLAYIHKRNIPITLSSDAHHSDDLINEFDNAAAMLAKIGFKKLNILYEGRWKSCSFNAHGINLS